MDRAIQPANSRRRRVQATLCRGAEPLVNKAPFLYPALLLSRRIFAMLILMALTTTGMTGPLLHLSTYFRTKNALVVKPV